MSKVGKNNKHLNKIFEMQNKLYSGKYTEEQLKIIDAIPWHKNKQRRTPSIAESKRILDATHYGMDYVKRRILEYAAARKRNPEIGKVLCLEGSPGVGKTTIAASIAKCLGLPLQKINMGSLTAGWELVGSNPTWANADAGMITRSIIKADTFNFVMLLDEIDKTAHNSANHVTPENTLLQIFDDNKRCFEDLFLGGISLDLSGILFVATCNNSALISPILLDRMELINIPEYSEQDKYKILTEYVIPELYSQYKISPRELIFDGSALSAIIKSCEGEGGIRSIRKNVDNVFLRAAYELESKRTKRLVFMGNDVYKTLSLNHAGGKKHTMKNGVGMVNTFVMRMESLEYVSIEVAISEGSGNWITTGIYLKENGSEHMDSKNRTIQDIDIARTALVQAGCIPNDYFIYKDVHIHFNHVKENTPVKGITLPIAAALYSAMVESALPDSALVFGELNILGDLLPAKRWPLYFEQARLIQARRIFMPTSIEAPLDGFPVVQSKSLATLLEQAVSSENNPLHKSRPIGFIHDEQQENIRAVKSVKI